MKVSIRQLEAAVMKLRQEVIGYTSDPSLDREISISMIEENPGEGNMTGVLTISGSRSDRLIEDSAGNTKSTYMSIEIYSYDDKALPRATRTETFDIK